MQFGQQLARGNQYRESGRPNARLFLCYDKSAWNRSKKSGYIVATVKVSNDKATGHEVFASGWLNNDTQKVWGRPVDVLVMPDGSMLISDDQAGVVYRVTYSGK